VKKVFSLLLITVLLFNWFGYRLLSSFLEEQASNRLESSLEQDNYDDSQLITVKIPVTYLPYYNNSPNFERVIGQVEIQGIDYKYVKRRIFHDSLELQCIPDNGVMKLKAAKNECFRFFNDLQHTGADKSSNSHHGTTKTFSTDYYTITNDYGLNKVCRFILHSSPHYLIRISASHHLIVEQPPEIA
jgi:hypothetical protein